MPRPPSQQLARADAGIAVFKIAVVRWVEPSNTRDVTDLIRESFDQLESVTASL